jgi:NTE family protein
VLAATMDTKIGTVVDPGVLDNDIRRLYGRGDFEHIDYRFIEEQGRHVLSVEALEKSWGPDFVRFGLALVTDFQSDAYFNAGASYRRHWLNSLGGEFRADAQLGYVTRFASELYQPLDPAGHVFVAPSFQAERRPLDLYAGHDRVARFIFATNDVGVDVGTAFSRWGEARVGFAHRFVHSSLDTGLPIFDNDHGEQEVLRGRFKFDQLDSLDFPRRGAALGISLLNARGGGMGTYTKYQLDGQAAYTVGPHTLQAGFEAAGALNGELPAVDIIQFGGFQQLSGYRTGQLLGQKLTFGRLVYLYRWREQRLLDGVYLGASLEAGRMTHVTITGSPTGLLFGASVFLGVDTPLGPLYLAYGHAKDGNGSAYLFLGRP